MIVDVTLTAFVTHGQGWRSRLWSFPPVPPTISYDERLLPHRQHKRVGPVNSDTDTSHAHAT